MDTSNWRGNAPPGGEPVVVDTGDWRAQLPPDSRLRIVNKIMETLKRHLPFSGQEGLQELNKIAVRFEEKIYSAAISQQDYLRKISLKMLTMENKSQNTIPNPLQSNSPSNSNQLPDSGSLNMQPQLLNQGQSIPMQLPSNQQGRQQLSQNIQNNIPSAGSQGSAGLPQSSVPGLNQAPMANVVGQKSNMSNMTSVSQNSVGNSMGQGMPSNMYANSQRPMTGRQPMVAQQQQSQNPQLLYQQQLLMKQKFQQGNLPHPLMQSHMQQQQNLLQPAQLQSSQQSGMQTSPMMQPSMMQSAPLSSVQQNQSGSIQQSSQSMLQQHQQPILRAQQQQQSAGVHQPQTQMTQQALLHPQQQQQMGQQSSTSNMQQNPLIGSQNSVSEMQQQQQHQQQQQQHQQQSRLLAQQNNLQNMHQQQQLMAQQNLSGLHHQQLGTQSNISGLSQQQQQLMGSQSAHQSMPPNQHSVQMMQPSKVSVQQQQQQNSSNLLPTQGQQSQSQSSQQHLMSQPVQWQQQLGLQQQSNPLQRDMQQRLQAAGSLMQAQNVIDQQKHLYQSQRALPETSSTSLDSTAQTGQSAGGDWQEEVYQKIKAMKDMYLPELTEMHQKITAKFQQNESLPQQPKPEQLEKLKVFKAMLERIINFLQVSKQNVLPNFKEKLGSYEKQIVNFINSNRPRKPVSSQQLSGPGQLVPNQMHSMQQSQSQITQVQPHENPINPSMQPNTMTNMQHSSLSQQSMMNSLQPGSNMDSGQGNALNSMQQVPVGSMQQNSASASQQANMNAMPNQSGLNMLQQNANSIQANSANALQHQHLKQQQEQKMLQSQQQLKQQFQHRQMLIQQQQQQQLQQQQLHQQARQQMPAQLQTHQMTQLHQMNDGNEMKMRQGIGVKPGMFQQHLSANQRQSYPHQQMKSGASFPISSPQLLQAASPQMPQHSSPQVDQQNLLSSVNKSGTSMHSASSPFVVPSPSTPLIPSPMPGDSEKPMSGTSSNAGNIGQQMSSSQVPAPSLAIGTPGISASPLLAEFTSTDGAHGSALINTPGKSSVVEQPLDRLLKAVKSMSSQALSASVSDIGSVVSMIDRIAGSAPGNGSRAAVGEDLVAMTKCRLQARNFITQEGMSGTRKMRRYTSAMPLNVVSSSGGSVNDSFKQLSCSDTYDLESTASSGAKRPRIEANHVLLEEIREINQRLIDTVVDISEEDVDPTAAAATAEGGEGSIIVKCSYSAVALCPSLKAQYASAQMSPIQPLRLLIPSNYPNCSPILLDRLPVEISKEYEDLSMKAKCRFSSFLRSLSQPMSLSEIAKTWDVCTRAVISEYAQQSGGGTFSSRYGTWENCLSAV